MKNGVFYLSERSLDGQELEKINGLEGKDCFTVFADASRYRRKIILEAKSKEDNTDFENKKELKIYEVVDGHSHQV